MEHDIALLTPTLVACVPASSGQKSPTRRGMLSTRVRALPGRQTAAHAWRTQMFSSATVEGGSSMPQIQTDISSQTCSIGFMSGLRADQSMTSTSCWSKKAAVSRAVWGGALSWTYTIFFFYYYYYIIILRPNTPVAHGNIWFLGIWMYRCRLAPSTTTSSLPPSSRLRMVRTDIRLPNRRIICIRRRAVEMKRFVLTIRSSWRSSSGVEIFIEPPLFLWCGRSVSRLRRKILLVHSWDTPSILATSRWELPSADNLTIRCSICSGKFCGMTPLKSSKKYQ